MPFSASFYHRPPRLPRLAESLQELCREIDELWPHRRSDSDGWIGDPSHMRRSSRHNPGPRGIVRALDVTLSGARGRRLVRAACEHSDVLLVIHAGLIYSRWYDFRAEPYTGENPHTEHVHIEVRARDALSDRGPWFK